MLRRIPNKLTKYQFWWHFEFFFPQGSASRAWKFHNQTSRVLLNYPKKFEFRKRKFSEYKTYNGYRNEYSKDLEKDQCLKNTSWAFFSLKS